MVTSNEDGEGKTVVLAPLEPKQVSIVYIRIEEGLLYTNIYRVLTFDQSCNSSKAGGDRSLE